MTTQTLTELVRGCLNLPDLVLLAFLAASVALGAQRGCIRTLLSLCGRFATVLGATFLARRCAPAVAKAVVEPLTHDLFTRRAAAYLTENGLPAGAADALLADAEARAAQTAAQLAEGVAFLLLVSVFVAALTVVLKLAGNAARLLTRFPPVGLLDRAAGAALGFLSGAALALLLLWLTKTLRPELFGPLGWLPPETIEKTVVLRTLLAYFPVI